MKHLIITFSIIVAMLYSAPVFAEQQVIINIEGMTCKL